MPCALLQVRSSAIVRPEWCDSSKVAEGRKSQTHGPQVTYRNPIMERVLGSASVDTLLGQDGSSMVHSAHG